MFKNGVVKFLIRFFTSSDCVREDCITKKLVEIVQKANRRQLSFLPNRQMIYRLFEIFSSEKTQLKETFSVRLKMPGNTNPSGGLKKPLNMVQGPVYPDIRKGPPRFISAGKHWTADVGRTMIDTGDNFETFYGYAVNVQSRDYNKTAYGQSSHKDVVNQAFRPPLRDPYLDERPLSRVPATINAIIPRGNPGSSSDTGGTVGYQARNNIPPDYTLSRMIVGEDGLIRSSADAGHVYQYRAIEDQVLPDLETKISVADVADMNPQVQMPFHMQQRMDLELANKQPIVSAGAGIRGPAVYEIAGVPGKFRESRHTPTSAESGSRHAGFFEPSDPKIIKENNRRQTVAFSAGTSSAFTDHIISPGSMLAGQIVDPLSYQNSAGFNPSFEINPEDGSITQGKFVDPIEIAASAGAFSTMASLPPPDVEFFSPKFADPLGISASASATRNISNGISHGGLSPKFAEDFSFSASATPSSRALGYNEIPQEQYSRNMGDHLLTPVSAGVRMNGNQAPITPVDYDFEEKLHLVPGVINTAPLDFYVDNSSGAMDHFTYVDRHSIPAQATPQSRFTKDNGKRKFHFRKKVQPRTEVIPYSGQNAIPHRGIGITPNMMKLAIK
jgi:hypothetical protein